MGCIAWQVPSRVPQTNAVISGCGADDPRAGHDLVVKRVFLNFRVGWVNTHI